MKRPVTALLPIFVVDLAIGFLLLPNRAAWPPTPKHLACSALIRALRSGTFGRSNYRQLELGRQASFAQRHQGLCSQLRISAVGDYAFSRRDSTQGEFDMAGMLQILTYLLGVYLIMKGVEIMQIGLASTRENRTGLIVIGAVSIVACGFAAFTFVNWQDQQALAMQQNMPQMPPAPQF